MIATTPIIDIASSITRRILGWRRFIDMRVLVPLRSECQFTQSMIVNRIAAAPLMTNINSISSMPLLHNPCVAYKLLWFRALLSIRCVSWANDCSLLFKSEMTAFNCGCKPTDSDKTNKILEIDEYISVNNNRHLIEGPKIHFTRHSKIKLIQQNWTEF